MGVPGFTSYLDRELAGRKPALRKLPRDGPCLVDGSGLAFHLLKILGKNAHRELAGAYEHLESITTVYVQALAQSTASTWILADGNKTHASKEAEKSKRKADRDDTFHVLYRNLEFGEAPASQTQLPVPPLWLDTFYTFLTELCGERADALPANYPLHLLRVKEEADQALCTMCRTFVRAEAEVSMASGTRAGLGAIDEAEQDGAFVLAQDSDFFFVADMRYVPLDSVENGLCRVYTRSWLANALRVQEDLMTELALAIGNDYFEGWQVPDLPSRISATDRVAVIVNHFRKGRPQLSIPDMISETAGSAFSRTFYENLQDPHFRLCDLPVPAQEEPQFRKALLNPRVDVKMHWDVELANSVGYTKSQIRAQIAAIRYVFSRIGCYQGRLAREKGEDITDANNFSVVALSNAIMGFETVTKMGLLDPNVPMDAPSWTRFCLIYGYQILFQSMMRAWIPVQPSAVSAQPNLSFHVFTCCSETFPLLCEYGADSDAKVRPLIRSQLPGPLQEIGNAKTDASNLGPSMTTMQSTNTGGFEHGKSKDNLKSKQKNKTKSKTKKKNKDKNKKKNKNKDKAENAVGTEDMTRNSSRDANSSPSMNAHHQDQISGDAEQSSTPLCEPVTSNHLSIQRDLHVSDWTATAESPLSSNAEEEEDDIVSDFRLAEDFAKLVLPSAVAPPTPIRDDRSSRSVSNIAQNYNTPPKTSRAATPSGQSIQSATPHSESSFSPGSARKRTAKKKSKRPAGTAPTQSQRSKEAAATGSRSPGLAGPEKLPIEAHREEILHRVAHSRVTIIHGETGSGKSSCLPRFLWEADKKGFRAMISQPRRIAARSLSLRVASQIPNGDKVVGLRLGGGVREGGHRAPITFCTTGYLVRLLAGSPSYFDNLSHLILDEIHERSADQDILVLLAKRLLKTNQRIKLVLMSATLQAKLFQEYFSCSPPVFVGAKRYPLTERFLGDPQFQQKAGPALEGNVKTLVKMQKKSLQMYSGPPETLEGTELRQFLAEHPEVSIEVKPDMVKQQLSLAVQLAISVGKEARSSILIFVSGMAEIVEITAQFEGINELILYDQSLITSMYGGIREFRVVAIHSTIPYEEQLDAWGDVGTDVLKVIVATNSAESSITLPDVDNVICLGTRRQLEYNSKKATSSLNTRWVSKASATQRAGRTARTRPGTVWHLYTRDVYGKMLDFDLPEIHTCPLDKVLLDLKTLVVGPVIPLLLKVIDPPSLERSQDAIRQLYLQGFIDSDDDDLAMHTPLGRFTSQLGLDLSLSALIARSILLGCAPEGIALAAVLSAEKSPFRVATPLIHSDPIEYHGILQGVITTKIALDGGLYSETLALVRLISIWTHATNDRFRREFCQAGGLAWARVARLAVLHKHLAHAVAQTTGQDASEYALPPPREIFCDASRLNRVRFVLYSAHPGNLLRYTPKKVDVLETGLAANIKDPKGLYSRMMIPESIKSSMLETAFPPEVAWSLCKNTHQQATISYAAEDAPSAFNTLIHLSEFAQNLMSAPSSPPPQQQQKQKQKQKGQSPSGKTIGDDVQMAWSVLMYGRVTTAVKAHATGYFHGDDYLDDDDSFYSDDEYFTGVSLRQFGYTSRRTYDEEEDGFSEVTVDDHSLSKPLLFLMRDADLLASLGAAVALEDLKVFHGFNEPKQRSDVVVMEVASSALDSVITWQQNTNRRYATLFSEMKTGSNFSDGFDRLFEIDVNLYNFPLSRKVRGGGVLDAAVLREQFGRAEQDGVAILPLSDALAPKFEPLRYSVPRRPDAEGADEANTFVKNPRVSRIFAPQHSIANCMLPKKSMPGFAIGVTLLGSNGGRMASTSHLELVPEGIDWLHYAMVCSGSEPSALGRMNAISSVDAILCGQIHSILWAYFTEIDSVMQEDTELTALFDRVFSRFTQTIREMPPDYYPDLIATQQREAQIDKQLADMTKASAEQIASKAVNPYATPAKTKVVTPAMTATTKDAQGATGASNIKGPNTPSMPIFRKFANQMRTYDPEAQHKQASAQPPLPVESAPAIMVLTGVYTWSQTAESLTVTVPLKGASVRSVDVYSSRCYVKVNYRPYLVNLDLYADIDDASEVVTVRDGTLVLNYQKAEAGEWPSLVCEGHKDKALMRERRYKAMEEKTSRTQEMSKKLRDRRIEDARMTTRMQMRVDEAERQRLDDLKAEEKEEAERKVYETLRSLEARRGGIEVVATTKEAPTPRVVVNSSKSPDEDAEVPPPILKDENSSENAGPEQTRPRKVSFCEDGPVRVEPSASASTVACEAPEDHPEEEDVTPMKHEDAIFLDADTDADVEVLPAKAEPAKGEVVVVSSQAEQAAAGDDELETVVPPPRQGVRMKMAFTARVFPTPMRESRKEEEEDWLLRNRRHMKGRARERLDAVDISERDPFWLKGKGDDFFRAGNYEGALNAYACALEIDETMTACLSNRAACFLKLGHFARCIEDCDRALKVLHDEREEELALAQREGFTEEPKEFRRTKEMRKKLHVRKGTALRFDQQFSAALAEYQLAQELSPMDEDLRADCARLLCLVQCAAQKDLGDTAFRRKGFEEALGCYNKALEYDPESASVLSNRSACFMCLKRLEEARADCSAALAIVETHIVPETATGAPSRNTKQMEEDKALQLKLWKRLGMLAQSAGDWTAAASAFRKALDLDETNLELAKKIKLAEAKINQE
ncbi:ATP-dependent RNA helicase DHX29 [Hondaea fermentalgiana]|uniref:ATP-dependent RNA helicase DHX29 n=1 Tax=Hondaea fermentalgiana TaxID=2315210 RepID=A0A2R5GGH2_9STRA|nr:ATP-dependent RNA helicase DHX29 [Hondaea fermentalgiana]|eukprot:GBG30002.1 ATP-dependent RNA helicase DHX29 [Hondaea fermentalgiana]